MRIFYDELLSVTNEDLDQNNTFYIPDGIKTIHSNAFLKASKLKKLHIPDSVDLIMTGSFLGCNNLKEINIPNNCPSFNIDHLNNISVINIDSKIKDVTLLTNLLINKATTTKINFKYDCLIFSFDKNKKYAVKKVENNIFTLTTDNFEDCVLITNNGIKKCKKDDLMPYIKDNDFDRFKRTHANIFLENINIFYQWIDIINNLKGNSFNYFPNEIVMLSIPSNKKAVKEYILKNKTWQKNEKKLSDYSKKEIIGYMKFSYALGFFSGNNEHHLRASEFLNKLGKEKINNITSSFFKTNINDIGYNEDYADFIINKASLPLIKKIYNDGLGPDLYNQSSKMKKYLNEQKLDFNIRNITKYLNNYSYITRKGNEQLYNEFKKYSEEYTTHDYDLMQDLYERSKEIAKYNSKKIMTTKDNEKEYYYKWLETNDPANFLLGDKVGCCARINDVGDGILRASITDDEVRNLVFVKKNKKTIGKATAYYNKARKYILFNNAEISSSVTNYEKEKILKALKRAVIDQVEYLKDEGIELEMIAMGMTRNDLEEQIKNEEMKIKHYDLLDNYQYISYFFGTEEFYTGDANDIEKGQCVLWESDKEYQKQLLATYGFKVGKR